MKNTCPVCGYPDLDENPKCLACFEICPSCRFQFGVSDRDKGYTYEQWRNSWVANGMIWDKGSSEPPNGWNPKKQLQNLFGK